MHCTLQEHYNAKKKQGTHFTTWQKRQGCQARLRPTEIGLSEETGNWGRLQGGWCREQFGTQPRRVGNYYVSFHCLLFGEWLCSAHEVTKVRQRGEDKYVHSIVRTFVVTCVCFCSRSFQPRTPSQLVCHSTDAFLRCLGPSNRQQGSAERCMDETTSVQAQGKNSHVPGSEGVQMWRYG